MTVETNQVEASVEDFRKLARIVTVDAIIPHPNADALELAMIGGWQCCVKIGELKQGDLALYCEIDSLLPIANSIFAFLEERGDVKLVGEVAYSRIKTIKLRKEISQGLLISLPAQFADRKVDDDLTAELGVLKYESTEIVKADVKDLTISRFQRFVNWIRGEEQETLQMPWPSFLKKSSQERVQNIYNAYNRALEAQEEFECTVKLDGASLTGFLIKDPNTGEIRTGVCSRNNELKTEDVMWTRRRQIRNWIADLIACNRRMFRTWRFILPRFKRGLIASDDNFVQMFLSTIKPALLKAYADHGLSLAIQGELVGPDIQSNFEGLDKRELFVYSIYVLEMDTNDGIGYPPHTANNRFKYEIVNKLGLKHVPVLSSGTQLPPTVKECVEQADGKSAFKKSGYREGVVYSSNTRDFTFKAISNSYLLKTDG